MMRRTPSLREVERRADPNVVILPTAPQRMVQQNYNRAASVERKKLREGSPFIAHYRHPQKREAMKRAEVMREVRQTPELMVLLMILESIPRDQRQGMLEKLALRAVVSPLFRQALEIIRSTMLNVGEQMDLMSAMDELANGTVA